MSTGDFQAAAAELELSSNARIVLQKRYQRKNETGEVVETPEEMFQRIAAAIAREEQKYSASPYSLQELESKFFKLMTSFQFLPNSPTLMNAGTDLGQLAACFVLSVGDSMEEIFDAVKHAALIHKSGGGTGFSFSRLRPKDSRVGSTGGVASGPISFIKIFNTATEQVKQGGTRRGANMGVLRVDHPDIMDFIRAKEREGQLNNFNLSVALTETFMQAVEKDDEYALLDPKSAQTAGTLRARDVFQLLVQKAWESGDPGIVFIDRMNADNPTPEQGAIESTNPCGEQPLLPFEACNLGSINVSKFYAPETEDGIDWDEFKESIHLSMRFLDNVIDASKYPLEQIQATVQHNRKVGLGIMGWADLLYQLEIPYNSRQGLHFAEKLMDFFQQECWSASKLLAQERGPFPAYDRSVYAQKNFGPYRNATTTTIAPTGTLSIIAGCSSGIEPLYALSFVRQVMDGENLLEVNSIFEQALKEAQCHSQGLMQEVAQVGSIQKMEHLPESIRRIFVTAMDIDPEFHLKMQAAFQKYTDNAVSKTVNLRHSALQEDIYRIYWNAYEFGCKGVTVYRDGSKSEQVLSSGRSKESLADGKAAVTTKERPEVVYGFTQKVKTGLGDLYLTVNEVDGQPFEVFATIGRSGRSITAKSEAIGRLVSLILRSGISVREVVHQLKGIGGEHPVFQKKGLLLSIPDAVAWVLENRYLSEDKPTPDSGSLSRPNCPECGEVLYFQEGCFLCQACGYTKCG